jgi:hypothetical protein
VKRTNRVTHVSLSALQKPRNQLVTLRAQTIPNKKRVASKNACRGKVTL